MPRLTFNHASSWRLKLETHMTMNRRTFLSGAAGVVGATMLERVGAQSNANAIRIGVPTGITGNWSALGAQVQRACRLYAKTANAKGGIDGHPIEFLYEDTQGDPAACVRKTTELVESRGVKLITGVISSPESLAIMPRLADWNAIYIASISGVGSMTAANFVPNAFRAC